MDSSPAPVGFNPRYEILETLGRGGMGIVYRALDRVEGQVVALKTLHQPLTSAPGQSPDEARDLRRFDREIRALSLLNHRGIVRLHDVGQREGQPYFTMEILRGLPLQAFLDLEAPGATELRWILRIALRILDALDCLHRAGFVHRDLKPSNVMVLAGEDGAGALTAASLLALEDPAVKLLDFGLVKPRESGLASGRPAPGTPLYMAPEQMDPQSAPDPRSDLYSLGVILYQLVTRRLPHETVSSALSGRPPPSPEARNPACPALFSATIIRLLDPHPHRRFASAGELSRSLLALLEERPAPAEAPPPRLQAPAFVGREEVQKTIRGHLEDARNGRGRILIVSGARGSGKSWLLDRSGLKTQAVLEHGLSYFQGRYSAGGALHQGLREVALGMILDLTGEHSPAALPELLGPWGGAFIDGLGIESVPELRALWPPADPAAPAELAAERILQAGAALFRAAARRPRLVLIDDLHGADDLDVQILARVARGIASLPLLIVSTCRPEALEASPWIERWQKETTEGGEAGPGRALHLGPFTDGEAAQMARSTLSPLAEIDPGLTGALLDRTGGVPRALETELGSMWAAGCLELREGRWRLISAPPCSAAGPGPVEPENLADLPPEDRELLLAASILGESFEPELLLAVAGEDGPAAGARPRVGPAGRRGDEERLVGRLHALSARGLLAETASGFSFARPGLRERAESLLDPERSRTLHARAAAALLALKGEAARDQWDTIASHFERGGRGEEALEFHLKAARRAAGVYANRRAIAAFRAALALVEGAARGPLVLELGQLHAQIGEYETALACLREAAEAAPAPSPSLLDEVGRIHQRRGDFTVARECFERSLALAGDDHLLLARARYRLGGARFDAGDLAGAAGEFRTSLELSGACEDLNAMAAAHSGLGLVEKRRARLEEASLHFREAIRCAEGAGNPGRAAAALNNLGNICGARGDDAEAVDCFRRSIALRERIGDRPGLGICLNNLARALGRRGEIQPALEAASRALRIFEEVGDRKGVLIAGENVGVFLLLSGDFPAARKSFLQARSLAERLEDRRARADVLRCLARLENSRGEPGEAERHIREGLRSLGEEGEEDVRAGLLAELVPARLSQGDLEGAGDALRDGLETARHGGSTESRGLLLVAQAELELARGDADRSVETAREALSLLEAGGPRFDRALAHRQLGRGYREVGPDWVDRAESHLTTALAMFEEMGAEFEAAAAAAEIAELWLILGETAEAEKHYSRASAALASSDAPRRLAELSERMARLPGGGR